MSEMPPPPSPAPSSPPPPVAPTDEPSPYQAHLAAQAADAAASDATPALLDVKARWAALSSTQQLRGKQLGVAAVIGVLGYGLYTANRADTPVVTAPTASKLDMGAGLRGDSLELKLRGDIQKVLDGQTMLGDRVSAIEQGKVAVGPEAGPGLAGAPADILGETGLPPALPGGPAYPPSPAGGAAAGAGAALTAPPDLPAPPAPPAPPQEKLVGAIGAATTAIVPKDAATPEQASKKSCGRSICRLVS